MIFRDVIKTSTQVLTTNAPALLTAFGAVGTVTTAVLTGKAAYEACGVIRNEIDTRYEAFEKDPDNAENLDPELTKTEMLKLTWLLYLPAATTGVVTVGAIILSHRVSSRRAAVLAAAYALNEGKLEEYREKVEEKFGVKKEKEVRDEINQDRVNRDHDDGAIIFSPLDGKVLIKDAYSGRTFWSSVDEINKAVNELNQEILINDSATISDFYDAIGLEHVSTSDHFGFTNRERLEVDWSTCTTPDGKKAVHVFEFVNEPVLHPSANASFR